MQIISMNTDGLFYKCDSPEESERVRKAIEEFAAEIQCPIEFTAIAEHRQEHINSYLQVIKNEDGSREVKGKGAWNPDPGINADHNAVICAKAMAEHMLNGTDIRAYIEEAAAEKRFLEFTKMQSSRASTIRVGGEPVGGMIRVYHSTIPEDELPPITIDPAGKSPEKRVARGCSYAPGLEWPDDLNVEWYVEETFRRMEQSSTEFNPENNRIARELEAMGMQVRGSGGGSARTKRSDKGPPANFAGCRDLEVFIGGSSGLIVIEDEQIDRSLNSFLMASRGYEIHRLDVLESYGINEKTLANANILSLPRRGWFLVKSDSYALSTSPAEPPISVDAEEDCADIESNDDFLDAMFGPDAEEALIVSYHDHARQDWTAGPRRYSRYGEYLDPRRSCYAAISVCEPENHGCDANGEPMLIFRRHKSKHRATYCIMLDDIGSKAKDPCEFGFPRPTVRLETSKNNFQYLYKLSEPITNRAVAQQLVDGIVAGVYQPGNGNEDGEWIRITDAGSGDIVRLFRLPFGSNLKHETPFPTVVHEMDFARTYSADEIFSWLGNGRTLDWDAKADVIDTSPGSQNADPDVLASHGLMLALAEEGLLKGREKDGWHEISCPWRHQHSDAADNGTKVLIRQDGTWWYYCHHGSCLSGADDREKRTAIDLYEMLTAKGYDVPHPTRPADPFANFDVSKISFVTDEAGTIAGAEEVAGVDMGFTVNDVDLINPPGICGDLCREMGKKAFRKLPEAYPLYALQLLSLVGKQHKTPYGARLNLLTLLIAPSAAGKETANSFLSSTAARIGRGEFVSNEPRSDKDIQRTVLDGRGDAVFVIDEAWKFFGATENKNSSNAITAQIEVLMQLMTGEYFFFSPLHKRNFAGELEAELKSVSRQLESEDLEAERRQVLEATRDKLNDKLKLLAAGIENPFVALAASSTPTGLDRVLSTKNIDKGLLGRGIVVRTSSQREKMNRGRSAAVNVRLDQRLVLIAAAPGRVIEMSDDAHRYLDGLIDHYDHYDRLNSDDVGAIYARAVQQIVKVASVLAVEDHLITVEHLRYGQALFERHVRDVGLLRGINELNDTPVDQVDVEELAQRIADVVLDLLDKAKGDMYISDIFNDSKRRIAPLRKSKAGRSIFDQVFDRLVSEGLVLVSGKKARAGK